MSLLHNPIAPYPLDELDVITALKPECENKDDRNLVIGNFTIYLTCQLVLGHGHREALPFAALWAKASACTYLNDTTSMPDKLRWAGDLTEAFCEEVIARKGMGAVVPLDPEGKESLEVLKLLTLGPRPEPPFPEGSIVALLHAAGASKRGIGMVKFVSKCVTCASGIASTMYDALKAPEKDHPYYIQHACGIIMQLLGNNFMHLPTFVLRAMEDLKGATDMPAVWESVTRVMCCTEEKIELQKITGDDPLTRRDRRAFGGVLPPEVAVMRDKSATMSLIDAMQEASGVTKKIPGAIKFDALIAMTAAYVQQSFYDYVPVTFMRKDTFEKFRADGRTKTVWDLSDEGLLASSWHSRYSDIPLHGRAVTDRRIYGERGDDIVYGVLIHPAQTDQFKALSAMYGPVAVQWDRSALGFATLCINDSSTSPWVVPATEDNLKKHIIADSAPRVAACMSQDDENALAAVCGALTGMNARCNFIEVQIHKHLTPGDISKVQFLG